MTRGFWKSGDPGVWITGAALAAALLMVFGMVVLILANGLGSLWPRNVTRFVLAESKEVIGEIVEREAIPVMRSEEASAILYRLQVKQGNRDLYGADFLWLDEAKILERESPADVVVIERREWGNLYGHLAQVKEGERVVAEGSEATLAALATRLPQARKLQREIREIETDDVGAINAAEEQVRLKLRRLEAAGVKEGPEVDALLAERTDLQKRYEERLSVLGALRQSATSSVVVTVAGGLSKDLPLAQVVRIYRPNQLGALAKTGVYLSKLWEFLSDDPREANTEGGIFPAIFGTVMMVLIMSVMVTPLGILAAFYLREYAKQGTFVSAVRIAVNNLAGVPSIVYGVFGVGFFLYTIGGSIDQIFFWESLPTPTFGTGGILWASLTLALLTVPVVIVSVEEGLASVPPGTREGALALGSTKFETCWRVVFPAVLPSVLTGMILAVARATGEVAPLMITGVVKLAPAMPLDGTFPFLHFDRKFMHLGFHIYDLGFQSPNVDAARPMVYMTTLLLILIVLFLNLGAITIRNRLKRRFASSGL